MSDKHIVPTVFAGIALALAAAVVVFLAGRKPEQRDQPPSPEASTVNERSPSNRAAEATTSASKGAG